MRIISDFKDYYDCAMSHGSDGDLVFARKSEDYSVQRDRIKAGIPARLQPFALFAHEVIPPRLTLRAPQSPRGGKGQWIGVDFHLLVFAGKLYPFALCCPWIPGERLSIASLKNTMGAKDTSSLHDWARFSAYVNKSQKDADADTRNYRTYHPYEGPWCVARRERFFALEGSGLLMDAAIEGRLPIVHASATREELLIQSNPRLDMLLFFRRMGSFEAFQELAMFLGNLAAPQGATVVVADKDRILKHGFDAMSFRKAPTKRHA